MRKDLLIKVSIYDNIAPFDDLIERIRNKLNESGIQRGQICEIKEVSP